MKKTTNKFKTIFCITLILLIAGAVILFIAINFTLVNLNNENSISRNLSVSRDSSITVLANEKCKNYMGLIYTDSADENNGLVHFAYLRKNKIFKDYYKILGGGSGNSAVHGRKICREDDETYNHPFFFIYGQNVKSKLCSVFECDENGYITKKIDEVSIPETAFIIAKDYTLKNANYDIIVLEGKVEETDISEMLAKNQYN